MSLGTGTRLGPYEIVAAIGAGGMGEVYRARDTRLKREVALKILPASCANDPDRLARFQREAEVLASLNHPNIAAIYGLEEADGIRALIMELVEGETLADRIAGGAIAVNAYLSEGWSNFHALEMAFTRRLSNRWQASGTYTLSVYRDGTASPAPSIKLVQDLGEEYGLATTDQRHRAVFNGIWDVGYGFQLSGLYFYGSGQRFATTYGGGDRPRLRPDGSIVPRNTFVGLPLHRVDFRLLRRFGLGGRRSIDGIAEAYNLFNHENYGSYTLAESNANYGKPIQNVGLAYQPRMVQLGFRIGF